MEFPDWNTLLFFFLIIMCLLGLVGSLLPLIPGSSLIVLGALVYAVGTGFHPLGWGALSALMFLFVVGQALQLATGAWGTRRLGGSRWAAAGATLGLVVGTFTIPVPVVGTVVGTFAGAALGEVLFRRRSLPDEGSGVLTENPMPADGQSQSSHEANGLAEASAVARAGLGASIGTLGGMLMEVVVALVMVALVVHQLLNP